VGNLRVRDHCDDLSVNGKVILKWILKRIGSRTELIWLSIGTCGEGGGGKL
jgi:hypothetical protein